MNDNHMLLSQILILHIITTIRLLSIYIELGLIGRYNLIIPKKKKSYVRIVVLRTHSRVLSHSLSLRTLAQSSGIIGIFV